MFSPPFFLRIWRAIIERGARRARRAFQVGDQAPKIRWEMNKGRLKRTIEEAVRIAEQNGVEVPGDVEFFEADPVS